MKLRSTFTSVYFIAAACLLLTAVVLLVGESVTRPTIQFGDCYLKADIARTPEQQERGLAGRDTVSSTYAMIFPFNQAEPSFWMKGMRTPIDIIWMAKDKRVIKIDSNVPVDDGAAYYTAGQPIDWVVEVAPGRAAACRVVSGTQLHGLRR